jgi:hypothetical protein
MANQLASTIANQSAINNRQSIANQWAINNRQSTIATQQSAMQSTIFNHQSAMFATAGTSMRP